MTRRCSSVAVFAFAAVAVLIAVPMYTNLNQQASLASFLRQASDGRVLTSKSLRLDSTTSTMFQLKYSISNISVEVTPSKSTTSTAVSSSLSLLPPPILATNISDDVHDLHVNAVNDDGIKLANLSSVDYSGCCGLGHRLSRMVNAAWIAKKLGYGLHTFWGYCGKDTEIFQHLFGVQEKHHLINVTSTDKFLRFHNEVPGFRTLKRYGFNRSCWCQEEQMNAHCEFYEDLRNRFRYKEQVDAFVKDMFHGHTVLGMHIRAGNGEKGDFANKKRGIENLDEWVHQSALRIKELVFKEQWTEPPLLYIATDTPSLMGKFRGELEGVMPVIEFPQERRDEGEGIFFGERGNTPIMTDYQCMRQWENAVTDMILLSYSDVLIAGRMSSFVQTMPMSLVFGRDQQKVTTPKCELNVDASWMTCSKTYMEWCCEVHGPLVHPRYLGEAISVPKKMDMAMYKPEARRHILNEDEYTQMPYYWKTRAYYSKTKGTD